MPAAKTGSFETGRGSAMRRIVVRTPGGPEAMRVEEAPTPAPGPGEVAVDVAYCGCNWADVMVRNNSYPHPTRYPVVPGCEISGRIRALGEGVDGFPEVPLLELSRTELEKSFAVRGPVRRNKSRED